MNRLRCVVCFIYILFLSEVCTVFFLRDDHVVFGNEDGVLRMSGYAFFEPFSDGIRVGDWVATYENGVVGRVVSYRLGCRVSERWYYPSGSLKLSLCYKHNLPYGVQLSYDENGKVTRMVKYAEDGSVVEEHYYEALERSDLNLNTP